MLRTHRSMATIIRCTGISLFMLAGSLGSRAHAIEVSAESTLAASTGAALNEISVSYCPQYHDWTPYTSRCLPPVSCDNGSSATGFRCRDKSCDEVGLYCESNPYSGWDRYWTSYSYGYASCGDWAVVTGISCGSDDCDRFSLECTAVKKKLNHCEWSDWIKEGKPFRAPDGLFIRAIDSNNNRHEKRFNLCKE